MLEPELPKLSEHHDLSGFQCGAAEIDDWLQKRARKGQQVGNASVYVFAKDDRVLGFYAFATGGLERMHAPRAVRQNAPDPVPVVLLARLGVDQSAQGRGIGYVLMQDAVLRTARVSQDVGFRALLIHCRDEAARGFYLAQVKNFLESPTDPLNLFLTTETILKFASDDE